LITITQKEEGGWWEGTLEGKTGWFPSNYVKDVKVQGNGEVGILKLAVNHNQFRL